MSLIIAAVAGAVAVGVAFAVHLYLAYKAASEAWYGKA